MMTGADAHSRSPVHGAVLQPVRRPGFTAWAVIAVWPFTVFRLQGAERSAYACIPRSHLPQFLRRLTAGRLDALITEYLGSPPTGRILTSNRRTAEPGLWDEVGQPRGLLPPERNPAGSYDYQTLDAESARTAMVGRPGKFARPGKWPMGEVPAGPPPPEAKPPESGREPPWKIILPLGAVLGAIAIGVGVIIGGGLSGGGGASPTATPNPNSTLAPTSTVAVVVPTVKPIGTPTATPTGSPTPTPTPTPTATPAPTATPTPTAEALCDLTITKTSDPTRGLMSYQVRVDWVCPPGVDTTTGATVHVDDALPIEVNEQPYSAIPPGPQVALTSATSGAIGCTGPPHPHPGAPGFDTNRFGCDVGILPANGSAVITVALDTGTGQTLTNTAVVDTDNSVPESNEGNNQAQITDSDCCG